MPIYLEALMVGQNNQVGNWAVVGVQFNQLGLPLGQPQPPPFSYRSSSNPPKLGIHLLWTVPSALRHGQTQANGAVDFPLLPNRWLVTRTFIAEPGAVPSLTVWVLESDYLGSTPNGTHVYPDPTGGSQTYYIGRRFDLASWNGTTTTYSGEPFLRAMGPGDATYVAIYDNMTNVLAFHDDMQNASVGWYSYSVCGWYSTPADDQLFGKTESSPDGFTTEQEWQEIMTHLQWTVGSEADQNAAEQDWQAWLQQHPITGGPPLTDAQKNLPAQSLCHGFIYKLDWQGFNQFYPINAILQGEHPPAVAIGANGPEAMAAWLADAIDAPYAEDLLLAFQEDMVFDYASNQRTFETKSHAARFGSTSAGDRWVVYQEQTTEPSNGEIPSGATSVPLDQTTTDALTRLNTTQATLNQDREMLASLKWSLYAAYWKLANYPLPQGPILLPLIQKEINRLTPLVNSYNSKVTQGSQQVDQQAQALRELLAPLKLKLNTQNQPRFEQRQDPVILLAGTNQDTKFAPPGVYDDEDTLFTRFTGQTLSALTINYSGDGITVNETLSADDFTDITWPTGVQIPKEIHDFWFETFLLDTNSALLLAQRNFQKAGVTPTPTQLNDLTAQIQRQQTLLWNQDATRLVDVRTISETAGFKGVPPFNAAVAAWTPPWAPIYMDWEIEWHPSATTPQDMLNQWSLGEVDFEWNGTQVTAKDETYSGRAILNGQIALGLQEKLYDFLDSNPNLSDLPISVQEKLREMAETLGQFDVVTQAMSGLIEELIMRLQQMNKLSPDDLGNMAQLLADAENFLPAAGSSLFFPLHAGHLRVTRIEVVDAFGQILRGSQLSNNLQPIRSKSFITPGETNTRYIQLTPRVTQDLRFDFRLVQFDDDTIPTNSSDLTSPISGWVIPNHINHSLTVFDPWGNNLGEVITIDAGNSDRDQETGLRWDAVPGSNTPLGAAPNFGSQLQHLNSFVNGLLLRGAQGSDALSCLLDVIDASLWKVDPLGQPMQGNLAILLGRPLAVVRARITLEVDGTPATNQAWENTSKQITDGFTEVSLPLRIGDIGLSGNGVMGYFLDNDYSQFYPYHGYTPKLAVPRRTLADRRLPESQMLAQIAQQLDSNNDNAEAASDPYIVSNPQLHLPPDGTTTHDLTLLVDPRGSIPVISGYLPVQYLTLSPGPVTLALNNMFVTFRAGPVLLNSTEIQLPLPAAIKGDWTWVERSGVTTWRESDPLTSSTSSAQLPSTRPNVNEGWLKLSGALGLQKP
ncbi:MAG: hypothetical protein F6J94_05655 [Moorea sp. SIO1F2]|uniref:hypothetical protein n=1 Tax=Moorena sp. SIO1F2 TaxID=2607819 RepID=UPI0013B86E3E|nr:hypothetical protein [Moorena sp. SIO1F2]NET81454.1 hypothetical protein [Moorena sp. SIO1F2]